MKRVIFSMVIIFSLAISAVTIYSQIASGGSYALTQAVVVSQAAARLALPERPDNRPLGRHQRAVRSTCTEVFGRVISRRPPPGFRSRAES